MPDAVGKELADAGNAFAAQGLDRRQVALGRAAGPRDCTEATKPAGTKLKRGDTVRLNGAKGQNPTEATSVPNVTGRRLDEARQALEAAGFEVLALTTAEGGQVRNESKVVSQSPAASASVPRGSLVLLYV